MRRDGHTIHPLASDTSHASSATRGHISTGGDGGHLDGHFNRNVSTAVSVRVNANADPRGDCRRPELGAEVVSSLDLAPGTQRPSAALTGPAGVVLSQIVGGVEPSNGCTSSTTDGMLASQRTAEGAQLSVRGDEQLPSGCTIVTAGDLGGQHVDASTVV